VSLGEELHLSSLYLFGKVNKVAIKALDILIVEDEAPQREILAGFLRKKGYRVKEAPDGEKAIKIISSENVDLMLVDLKMPKMDGIEVLKEAKKINPDLDAIVITAYGSVESAVNAMKLGAIDYITKPIDLEELLILLERVSRQRDLIRENELLKEQLEEKKVFPGQIIYKSQKMAELINLCGRVANSKATVLLQGESGTGKELFARLIHNLSPRSKKPMVVVNCGALQETLIESELFGHEKGAFTGAIQRRIGRCEHADGGTLFLDEVGELPLSLQVKLLRFIQEGEFQRLGGNQVLKADVRIIAATNRDLSKEVEKGKFREDLYFRLNVIAITIPPLRERKEDIPLLLAHFLTLFSKENYKSIKGYTKEAFSMLLRYDYPGNVRELENIVERAVVISKGDYITTDDLPFTLGEHETKSLSKENINLKNKLEALERDLILQALEEAKGNQSKAANKLGISERMLRYKLKRLGIK